jgi:hypothetical protein
MDKLTPLTKARLSYGIGLALIIVFVILTTILTTDAYAVNPYFINTPFAAMFLSAVACFIAGAFAIGMSYGDVFVKEIKTL